MREPTGGIAILLARMRIAVLSDIHANLAALEAVASDLPSVDQVWVLGDIVGYGPNPNEVITTLQAMGARSVLGNHDGAAIGTVDASYFNPDARTAIEWTAGVVDPNARAYLAALPEVRCDGPLTAVHGSPRDPIWEYITGPQIAAANFAHFTTRLCLFGHTHLPVVFRAVDGGRVEAMVGVPGERVELGGVRALLNPGSVGSAARWPGRCGLCASSRPVTTPRPTPSNSDGSATTWTAPSVRCTSSGCHRAWRIGSATDAEAPMRRVAEDGAPTRGAVG